MTRPLEFAGDLKRNVEQQLLITVSRGWAGWISRAARLRRALRYNHAAAKLENLSGNIIAAIATGGVLLVGPILTRSDNE